MLRNRWRIQLGEGGPVRRLPVRRSLDGNTYQALHEGSWWGLQYPLTPSGYRPIRGVPCAYWRPFIRPHAANFQPNTPNIDFKGYSYVEVDIVSSDATIRRF